MMVSSVLKNSLHVPLLRENFCSEISQDHQLRQKKRDETIRKILPQLAQNQNKRKRAFYAMFFLTGSYCLLEFAVGSYCASLALISDGFHMLSDLLALIVGFCAVKYASQPSSDPAMTFGWVRAEVLGAFVNVTALLAICFTIMVEAIQRFLHPGEVVDEVRLVLFVGTVGLFINLTGLFIFGDCCCCCQESGGINEKDIENHGRRKEGDTHEVQPMISINSTYGHSTHPSLANADFDTPHNHHGHSHNFSDKRNMNMHGVYLHIMGDALGSVVVIVSAVIMEYTDWEYRNYADPACSLLIVWIIAFSTWPLFKDSAKILIQRVDDKVDVMEIRKCILGLRHVVNVHELHVWTLAGNKNVGSAHVTIDAKCIPEGTDALVLGTTLPAAAPQSFGWRVGVSPPECTRCPVQRPTQLCPAPIESTRQQRRQAALKLTEIRDSLKTIFHQEGVHSSTIQLEFSYFGEYGCTDKLCANTKQCLKRQCCLQERFQELSLKQPTCCAGAGCGTKI